MNNPFDFYKLNPDYIFDLKGLWEVFHLQPSYKIENQTIDLEFDGTIITVNFMEFVMNHKVESVIADIIHMKSHGAGWPFAAGKILTDIEKLSNDVKAIGYNFDIFQYKKDLLLDSWMKLINPETEQSMIDEFEVVLLQNLDFHLASLMTEIAIPNSDRLIKTELNQNALAFILMLMVGKSAFKVGNKSKAKQYDHLVDLFKHYLKFKDEGTGEYKTIDKTNFLKKVSDVRNKERDRDRMKVEFNRFFDEIFKDD
jgi:hypothetical protein